MAYANPVLKDKTAFATVWKDGSVTVWTVIEAQQARRDPDWHADLDLRPLRGAEKPAAPAKGKRSRTVRF